MKHLNKIASIFCGAAFGLLALASCEGGDLYSVNAPDWISQKIDSIEKSKTKTGEVLEGRAAFGSRNDTAHDQCSGL